MTCRIDCCTLWPQAQLPFCHAHAATWRANGRPGIDEFTTAFVEREATEDETVRLGALPPLRQLEVQYALQCRADDRTVKTLPSVVMRVVRFLAGTAEGTLLDRSEAQWRVAFKERAPNDANARSLLIYARRRVADLLEAGGWDAEYPRGWQLRRLGHPAIRPSTSPAFPSGGCGISSNVGCAGGWAPGCTWRSPAAGCAR